MSREFRDNKQFPGNQPFQLGAGKKCQSKKTGWWMKFKK